MSTRRTPVSLTARIVELVGKSGSCYLLLCPIQSPRYDSRCGILFPQTYCNWTHHLPPTVLIQMTCTIVFTWLGISSLLIKINKGPDSSSRLSFPASNIDVAVFLSRPKTHSVVYTDILFVRRTRTLYGDSAASPVYENGPLRIQIYVVDTIHFWWLRETSYLPEKPRKLCIQTSLRTHSWLCNRWDYPNGAYVDKIISSDWQFSQAK